MFFRGNDIENIILLKYIKLFVAAAKSYNLYFFFSVIPLETNNICKNNKKRAYFSVNHVSHNVKNS